MKLEAWWEGRAELHENWVAEKQKTGFRKYQNKFSWLKYSTESLFSLFFVTLLINTIGFKRIIYRGCYWKGERATSLVPWSFKVKNRGLMVKKVKSWFLSKFYKLHVKIKLLTSGFRKIWTAQVQKLKHDMSCE